MEIDSNVDERLSIWWMPPVEEKLWELNADLAGQRLMNVTGFWILAHTALHSLSGVIFNRTRLTAKEKLMSSRQLVLILHSVFAVAGGIWSQFQPEETGIHEQHRLFGYSWQHDMTSTITAGFWCCSIFFAVANAGTLGWQEVWKTVGKGGILLGLDFFGWKFPTVLLFRTWQWWSIGELAVACACVNKMLLYFSAKPKLIIYSFMVSLGLLVLRIWMYGFLVLWGYRWVITEAFFEIPKDLPVSEFTISFVSALTIGAIGVCYFSFLDFRSVLADTKEWAEKYGGRKSGAQPAAGQKTEGDQKKSKLEKSKESAGQSKGSEKQKEEQGEGRKDK